MTARLRAASNSPKQVPDRITPLRASLEHRASPEHEKPPAWLVDVNYLAYTCFMNAMRKAFIFYVAQTEWEFIRRR